MVEQNRFATCMATSGHSRSWPARLCIILAAAIVIGLTPSSALALDNSPPYQMIEPGMFPQPGPGLPSPSRVFGKELSFDGDVTVAGAAFVSAPGQVTAWDGYGGVADGVVLNPVGAPVGPYQIDALANHADTLFMPLLEDRSHLIFSVASHGHLISGGQTPGIVPSVGPLATTSGLILGGAAELSYELGAISPRSQRMGVWATRDEILAGYSFDDIDALELWGPDPQMVLPGETASAAGDSDKFSIKDDYSVLGPGGAYAVWNKGNRPATPGYLLHSDLMTAISPLMGWVGATAPASEVVDLDALMVLNAIGTNPDVFDAGDRILLSLRQIVDGQGGFLATGSELIILTHNGTQGISAEFLYHNGHLWDKEWAMANLQIQVDGPTPMFLQLDINALEAASVPEPGTLLAGALLAGLGGMAMRRRRAVG